MVNKTKQLELQVMKLIEEYEKEVGLTIDYVELEHESPVFGRSTGRTVSVAVRPILMHR